VNYGTEAETGLCDLLMFDCQFVLSLPFALAIAARVAMNFWLLFIHFLWSIGPIVSFTVALIAFRPTQSMGGVVGLGILLSFFVIFVWAMLSWLYTDDGSYEKRILSILPSAPIPYTFAQIVSGNCVGFDWAEHLRELSSRDGICIHTRE
jgi:hypothetical protein